jgi:NNP family nitrate/nitrite transporter-like MFS transporter
MPAVYESLVRTGLTRHVAWRVSFIVPGVIITSAAIALLILCPDTPTGKWADRHQVAENNLRRHAIDPIIIVDIPGTITPSKRSQFSPSGGSTPQNGIIEDEKKIDERDGELDDNEAQLSDQDMIATARGEIIQKPTFRQILRVSLSPQTIVLGVCYFSSFGGELSVNSILGSYYGRQFPRQGLQTSSNWAAMFGLMNVVWRPLGGVVADQVYRRTQSVWSKKLLLHTYCLIAGAFLVAIGMTDQHSLPALVSLVSVGFAFFLDGANGLNFSVVPHVHPQSNGVVSGFTGACGNLGGIVFAIVFRYQGTDYNRALWIIGVIMMSLNVAVCWIRPIPKGQIGGR